MKKILLSLLFLTVFSVTAHASRMTPEGFTTSGNVTGNNFIASENIIALEAFIVTINDVVSIKTTTLNIIGNLVVSGGISYSRVVTRHISVGPFDFYDSRWTTVPYLQTTFEIFLGAENQWYITGGNSSGQGYAPLSFPHGARLTSFTFKGRDTDFVFGEETGHFKVRISKLLLDGRSGNEISGAFNIGLGTGRSVDSNDVMSVTVPLSHIVDNKLNSYNIYIEFFTSSAEVRFFGAYITYVIEDIQNGL